MESKTEGKVSFLTCEKNWLYDILILIGGFFGAYTYILRGNIFCNAQTGNVVLMGIAFGSGDIREGVYYLVPISAYLAGAFFSELLPNPVKKRMAIRWDTLLILIEMVVVLVLGFVPETAPVQISQVAINFIASMQYNTFRQAEGIPVATTFATNHIRQIGVGLAKELQHRYSEQKTHRKKLNRHFKMLSFFAAGAVTGTVCCHLFSGRAIWITLLPFTFLAVQLLYADLVTEREQLIRKPSGH